MITCPLCKNQHAFIGVIPAAYICDTLREWVNNVRSI